VILHHPFIILPNVMAKAARRQTRIPAVAACALVSARSFISIKQHLYPQKRYLCVDEVFGLPLPMEGR
jgi:hypothetical protein